MSFNFINEGHDVKDMKFLIGFFIHLTKFNEVPVIEKPLDHGYFVSNEKGFGLGSLNHLRVYLCGTFRFLRLSVLPAENH